MSSESASSRYRILTTQKSLRDLFEKRVQSSETRGRDGVLPASLARDLKFSELSACLRSGDYSFIQYREVLRLKNADSLPRRLSVASARDRIVLSVLGQLLRQVFPDCVSLMPQNQVRKAVRVLQAGTFDGFVKLDVKDFFPSIEHSSLHTEIRRKIRKASVLRLIELAIETPTVADGAPRSSVRPSRGVPQGLSISGALADISMRSFDLDFLREPRVAYFRYVDDILVLCDLDRVDDVEQSMRKRLEGMGLQVHPRGTTGVSSKSASGALAGGFDYLGYTFIGSKVSVRRSSIQRLERRIVKKMLALERIMSADIVDQAVVDRMIWQINLHITGCYFEGGGRGWVQYYSQLTDVQVLKRLDYLVAKRGSRLPGAARKFESFVATYWEIRHPGTRNKVRVPNFSAMGINEKRDLLLSAFGRSVSDEASDREIGDLFRRLLGLEITELERDLGHLS